MKALRIHGRGGPEVLKLEEVDDPTPGPSEVVIRVQASALNRADLLQCLGRYPAPPGAPADIPGLEYAGVVESVGAAVRGLKAGERVMGIVSGGAFAERLVAHEREVIRMPDSLGFRDAAALPEALITAYDALVLQGGARSGDVVLIHAVASGVGSAATQLMNALGATVLGTSRSAEKLERMAGFGLTHPKVVSSDGPQFAAWVKERSGGRGADLALDLVGGGYLPETVEAMASRGRVLLVGTLAGNTPELPLGKVLQKRLKLIGTVLRSRPLEEKIQVAQAFEHSVLPLVERGLIRPIVDGVFPFTEVEHAFGQLAANATLGKVVLSW